MPSPAGAAAARVREFLRQRAISKTATDDIYGVHFDPDGEMANLYASDLHVLLANQRTPEEQRVLDSAVQEYRAGHRTDRATAKDPSVVYTPADKTEYQRALVEHYTAVRALIRTQNLKEPEHAERP